MAADLVRLARHHTAEVLEQLRQTPLLTEQRTQAAVAADSSKDQQDQAAADIF